MGKKFSIPRHLHSLFAVASLAARIRRRIRPDGNLKKAIKPPKPRPRGTPYGMPIPGTICKAHAFKVRRSPFSRSIGRS